MRKYIVYIIAAATFAPLIVPVAAVAQNTTTPTTTSTTTTTTNTTTPSTTTTTTTPTTTLEERITKRKTELKTKLDALTQKKIQLKCKAAQTVLTNMKTRNQTAMDKRSTTYKKIDDKLTDLTQKLTNQKIDTTELKTAQIAFDAKVKLYNGDVATYQQALDDAIAVDCTQDPVGFKASLDSLRTMRQQVLKDAADIKTLQPQLAKALNGVGILLANQQGATQQGGTQ